MNRALVIGVLAVLSAACGGQTEDSAATAPTWPKTGCPPGTDLVDGRCRVREIYVPGGTFTMGRGYCPVAGVHQLPPSFEPCPLADTPHEITVAPFWMEATLRTRAHYEEDPDCPSQELECAKPDVYIPEAADISIAQPDYDGPGTQSPGDRGCGEEGKRHIDEAQWEWAATWGGTRTYPWGEAPPTCALANIDAKKCPPKIAASYAPELSAAASYPPSPEGTWPAMQVRSSASPSTPTPKATRSFRPGPPSARRVRHVRGRTAWSSPFAAARSVDRQKPFAPRTAASGGPRRTTTSLGTAIAA